MEFAATDKSRQTSVAARRGKLPVVLLVPSPERESVSRSPTGSLQTLQGCFGLSNKILQMSNETVESLFMLLNHACIRERL